MRISKQLIDKYNIPVPRYTSYPPANHFKDDFSENEAVKLIEQSNQNGDKHIAIYIHIPFCSKICFYCGCNACSIKNEESIQKYFQSLHKELHRVFALLDK
ncbi:MAG TPA: coproporphyrinogen III oxidase, partial [Bacteroidales bacterium]|nr:coproporphyrinogen III oxidase [Bacteroidales bacterium]